MNRFKVLFYSLTAVLSVILVLYGLNIFPTPGTDSRVFIPTALLYARGFGLVNPLYDVSVVGVATNVSNAIKFNYYVPFYPMLLGTLGKINPGIKTIFFICSMFSIAGLFLYIRAIASVLPARLSNSMKVFVLCSLVYVATYLIPTVGRPENLTVLLVFMIYILYDRRYELHPALYNLLICVIFGVMFATQIICFYFCFIFFLVFELLNARNLFITILINTARFWGVALIFFAILSASPHGFTDTVDTIRLHASSAMTRSDRSAKLFVHYWLFSQLNFGFLILFLVCTGFYLRTLFVKLKDAKIMRVLMVIALQLMVLYGIARFILYASPTVYNATQFILPLSVYLFLNIISLPKSYLKTAVYSLSILTYVAGTVVFLRVFILFVDYKTDKKDYAAARPIINRLVQNSKNVYITVNLWPLVDDASDVKFFDGVHFKKDDTLIIQQIYLPFANEFLSKCTIIYDWRTTEQRKFLGIPLTNTPQGYSFTVCRVN